MRKFVCVCFFFCFFFCSQSAQTHVYTLCLSNSAAVLQEEVKTFEEKFEILSLVGNLSGERGHLHISLGRADGSVIGGHVMGDHLIYTTAEVVIGECLDVTYDRIHDDGTGCPELTVKSRQSAE